MMWCFMEESYLEYSKLPQIMQNRIRQLINFLKFTTKVKQNLYIFVLFKIATPASEVDGEGSRPDLEAVVNL
nr:hypothetical protein [Tanacetum cinerariifolium]